MNSRNDFTYQFFNAAIIQNDILGKASNKIILLKQFLFNEHVVIIMKNVHKNVHSNNIS